MQRLEDEDSAEALAGPIIEALDSRRARLIAAIEASGAYSLRQGGVVEFGPYLVRACISCERRAGAGAGWVLALVATVVRWPESTVAEMIADVSWFHEPTLDQPAGYIIHEASAKPAEYQGPISITRFLAEFDRLETAMLCAIRRGRPPRMWTTRWRRLLGRCRPPWTWY